MSLEKLVNRTNMFTEEDIIKDDKNYEGKLVVLKSSYFKEEFRIPENQLVKNCSGFGCDPEKMGRAVYATFINDGERFRTDRSSVLGILKPSVANDLGLCSCGNELNEELVMNALSRKDNDTYICKECENKELEEELKKLNL